MYRFTFIAALIVAGCGAADDKGGAENPGAAAPKGDTPIAASAAPTSFYVQTPADLPACNVERKGALAYIAAPASFLACDGDAWRAVEVRGEKGAPGAAGEKGADGSAGAAGTAGKDGSANRVIRTVSCNGLLTGNIRGTYTASELSSGDVFVTGGIKDALSQYMNSYLYSPVQVGHTVGSMTLTYDSFGAATAGYWMMSMNRETLVATFIYNDLERTPAAETFTISGTTFCSETEVP